jgi:hypothetical protein
VFVKSPPVNNYILYYPIIQKKTQTTDLFETLGQHPQHAVFVLQLLLQEAIIRLLELQIEFQSLVLRFADAVQSITATAGGSEDVATVATLTVGEMQQGGWVVLDVDAPGGDATVDWIVVERGDAT